MSLVIILASTGEPIYITGGPEAPINPIYLWDDDSGNTICEPVTDESQDSICDPPVNLDRQ